MAKITDDYFANLPGAGPKRLYVPPTAPQGRRPWWAILVLLVLTALVGGGGWYLYRDRVVASPQPPEVGVDALETDTPQPYQQVANHREEVLEEPVHAAPVSVVQETTVDGVAIARQRRALADQVSSLDRGVATIERTVAEHRRALVRPQAQITDSQARHWPKPGGTDTYEQHLVKLRAAAKARGDGHAVFTIDGQWQTFRDNQSKTLFEIKRLQDLIESGEKRIAAAKAERAAAQADLAALPEAASAVSVSDNR